MGFNKPFAEGIQIRRQHPEYQNNETPFANPFPFVQYHDQGAAQKKERGFEKSQLGTMIQFWDVYVRHRTFSKIPEQEEKGMIGKKPDAEQKQECQNGSQEQEHPETLGKLPVP